MMSKKNIFSFLIFLVIAIIGFWLMKGDIFLPAGSNPSGRKTENVLHQPDAGKEIFGMKIEDVATSEKEIAIIATGAEFIIYDNGTMECWQRIPQKRKVAEVKFDQNAWPFRVASKDEYGKTLAGNGLEIEFSGDSLAVFRFKEAGKIKFIRQFDSEYEAQKDGRRIFIDQIGGFGIYPAEIVENGILNADLPAQIINYDFAPGQEVWLSVFPPRQYDWKTIARPLAHTGREEAPYSPNELIKEASQYAKVFTLHSFFWPGGDKEPWLIPEFTPSNMNEFLRVRDQVHDNGMKFVVYASPYYSTASDFFAEINKLINEYGVDGVYYDGISMDFRKSYEIIKKTRQMLGDDKIIYVHASIDPFNSTLLYAPFIDAYADYLLRGESGRPNGVSLDKFLRYTVSGYNISGAAGYWLHYGSAEENQSEYLFNLPDDNDIELALKNHVYFPWSDTMYRSVSESDRQVFVEKYFGKLSRYLKDNFQ